MAAAALEVEAMVVAVQEEVGMVQERAAVEATVEGTTAQEVAAAVEGGTAARLRAAWAQETEEGTKAAAVTA